MGTETNYNRYRYAVLQQGQVGMFQVGSPTLGQLVGADDIEKAAVGWDVYRIAKLADLKVCTVGQLCAALKALSDRTQISMFMHYIMLTRHDVLQSCLSSV